MDELKDIIKRAQQSDNLPTLPQKTSGLKINNDNFELSIYGSDLLTTKSVIENTAKIKMAFPSLPIEFFDLLQKRIKEKGFSDKKFTDAVNHVIDTCIYPNPTIANFLSYDKTVKLYTYHQITAFLPELQAETFKQYRPVKVENCKKPFYAHISDIERYNLEPWTTEKTNISK